MKTITERVDDIPWLDLTPNVRKAVLKAMKELAKDQREKCAEAVVSTPTTCKPNIVCREDENHRLEPTNCVGKDEAQKAAMNARIE